MVSYGSNGSSENSGDPDLFSERERRTDVGQTQDTPDPTEIFWRERQLIQEKLRLLLQGRYREPKTEKLDMRISHTIKEIYRRAPESVKRAARKALEAVLISWFLGETQIDDKIDNMSSKQTLIFNININHNENTNNVEIKLPDRLVKALEDLEDLLDFIAYRSSKNIYPQPVKQRAARGLDTLKELRKYMTN